MQFPEVSTADLQAIFKTLTRARLSKYLDACRNNEPCALQLYVLNTRTSAAFLVDLHYVEVALRNRFDAQITQKYGEHWFHNPGFLALMDARSRTILHKAQQSASKYWSPIQGVLPPGKVVAELTFGFWLKLTDSRLEHQLWVPCLHRIFGPNVPPKRAHFNQGLEKLRHLRNRVAHHEPIFHLALSMTWATLNDVARLLCPVTARVTKSTSTTAVEIERLVKFSGQFLQVNPLR